MMILREYTNVEGRITATTALKCKCGRVGPRVPMNGPYWDSFWDDHRAAVAAAKDGWRIYTRGAVEYHECPCHVTNEPAQMTLALEETCQSKT